ncbi:MAG: hypothetical protein V1827_04455 [Candidatus Micrarchaeota archaeon]
MVQPNARTPAPADRKGLWFGVKNGVAVGVAAAAILFAGWHNCKGAKTETIMAEKRVEVAVERKVCDAPKKGDKKCEAAKGENDPFSANWDPGSCGFCGDDQKQPWETPENCAVDFHCKKDGVLDKKTTYGAIISDGKTFRLSTVTKDACKTAYVPPRNPMGPTTVSTEAKKPAGSGCPKPPPGNEVLGSVVQSVRRTLNGQGGTLRGDGAVPIDVKANGVITLSISANGTVEGVGSVRYSWKTEDGSKSKSFSASDLGIDVAGREIGYRPGYRCTLYVFHTLPKATN